MSHPPPSGPAGPGWEDQPRHGGQPGWEDQPRHGDQPHWGEQPSYAPQPPYGQYGPPFSESPYGKGRYGPPGPSGGNTNILAILALVFAFVFAPAAIVLGHLARRQIRQTHEQGDQLAFWGLLLGYVFTGLYLLFCCGWLGVVIWAGANDGSAT
ncbi:DUF4190 domain-containing protein [Micromonospora sp. WMMD882]|uniref:DUF4190 domain-containing protein n=1 Tax=Micromonospora sp. WMMD882 TaxID=3015151 RepID=UPI00248B29B4|nr:DUF4190 domain-containing protein [Micromonospora sp. WMMD882]WBB77640.1 DUF4190 domain-containing protein [Micromonospora sp. WMMD882]